MSNPILGATPVAHRIILVLLASLILTSGCGLKGDLYLPADAPSANRGENTPAAATTTEDERDDNADTHP